MEKTINIIVAIVVIAATAFGLYTLQQFSLRSKELDKKRSDNLEQQKQINDLIIEKLKSNEIDLMTTDQCQLSYEHPSKNGKTKTKREAKREVEKK